MVVVVLRSDGEVMVKWSLVVSLATPSPWTWPRTGCRWRGAPGWRGPARWAPPAITCHHLSSPALTCHHLPSPAITCHQLSSPVITCLNLPSLDITYHHLPSPAITCHYIPPFAITCHNLSPAIALHHTCPLGWLVGEVKVTKKIQTPVPS